MIMNEAIKIFVINWICCFVIIHSVRKKPHNSESNLDGSSFFALQGMGLMVVYGVLTYFVPPIFCHDKLDNSMALLRFRFYSNLINWVTKSLYKPWLTLYTEIHDFEFENTVLASICFSPQPGETGGDYSGRFYVETLG